MTPVIDVAEKIGCVIKLYTGTCGHMFEMSTIIRVVY